MADVTLAEATRQLVGELDYEAFWLTLRIEGVPVTIPNPPAHGRALRLHDLHHALTGYDTSLVGECQISAWELAGGSGRYVAALGFDLAGTGLGVLLCPRKTFAAFVRGRRSRTLFHVGFDSALGAQRIADLRRKLGVPDRAPPPTLADRAQFALAASAGVASLLLWPLTTALIVVTCLMPAPRELQSSASVRRI